MIAPKCKKAVTLCGICIRFETISNIHYGYVAFNAGILPLFAEFGAGAAQISDNSLRKKNQIANLLFDLNVLLFNIVFSPLRKKNETKKMIQIGKSTDTGIAHGRGDVQSPAAPD